MILSSCGIFNQQTIHLLSLRTLQSLSTPVHLSPGHVCQRQQNLFRPPVCRNYAAIQTVNRTSSLRQPKVSLKNDHTHSASQSRRKHLSTYTHNGLISSLSQINACLRSAQRAYSTVQPSSLFVSGADDSYQSPVQVKLDLETLLSDQNIDKLRRNLTARGLAFDLDQLIVDYKEWQEVDETKTKLETQRLAISRAMAVLVKDKKADNVEARKEELTRRGKDVKEQLRETMPMWYSGEEKVMLKALKLPADLHPSTPEKDKELDVWKGTVTAAGVESHVKIAEEQGLLKFSNVGPRAVYLLGELAELEQSLLHNAARAVNERGFAPFTGSEIFRTVVVEGSGIDQRNAEEIFTLHQKEDDRQSINAYHLKGNSLLSYAAFFGKLQVKAEHLPVKFYSIGRHYRPPAAAQDFPGLYGAVQSNRVTVFGASASESTATELYHEMVEVVWDLVQGLGVPARKVLVSASRLEPSESLRSDIEVWAPGLQQYVQMGHVSFHGDYPSCRLLSRVHPEGTPLHMVCGVVLDTAQVLATILEHSVTQGQFKLMRLPCLYNKA